MSGFFEKLTVAPPDSILGLVSRFKADTHPQKVDLGVGAYRTEEGKPCVLNSVKKAETAIFSSNENKEYLPIDGLKSFRDAAARIMYGSFKGLDEGRVATFQSISGTGALGIGMAFLAKFFSSKGFVYISNPTWGNHQSIILQTGLQPKTYRYFDSSTLGLDINGMLEDLRNAPSGSIIMLHVCAHNPTGVDPSHEQWKQICAVCKEKEHLVFFDSAYQGFATGNLEADSFSVRLFAEEGLHFVLAQSFAKNMGLYGERAGLFSVVCGSKESAEAVTSQVNLIIRAIYSNPPCHPARIASKILNTPELMKEWEEELLIMSSRIKSMRKALYDHLVKLETPGRWDHIINQIGMFSFTGLKPNQCKCLTDEYHIYLLSNGRISMAGLNGSNVEYVAKAIDDTVRRF